MVRGESHVLYLNIIIRTRFKWFENWSNCNVMEISENLMQSMCAFFYKIENYINVCKYVSILSQMVLFVQAYKSAIKENRLCSCFLKIIFNIRFDPKIKTDFSFD